MHLINAGCFHSFQTHAAWPDWYTSILGTDHQWSIVGTRVRVSQGLQREQPRPQASDEESFHRKTAGSPRLCGNTCLLSWFQHPACLSFLHPWNLTCLSETFFLTDVQLEVVNGIVNSPPTPQFSYSEHEAGWTLIFPLNCFADTIVNNVDLDHAISLLHTHTHSSWPSVSLMGQGCLSRLGGNGPPVAVPGFLNCQWFGEFLFKFEVHGSTLLWVDMLVAWGIDSYLWGPLDLQYNPIQLSYFTNGESWGPNKESNLPKVMRWE